MNRKKRFSRQAWRVIAIVLSVMLMAGGLFTIYAATDLTPVTINITDEHKTTHTDPNEICPDCGGCTCRDAECLTDSGACHDCTPCICSEGHTFDSCTECPACGKCKCVDGATGKCIHTSDGAAIGKHEIIDHSKCHLLTDGRDPKCAYCGMFIVTDLTAMDYYTAIGEPAEEGTVCDGKCHEHGTEDCKGSCPADSLCICDGKCYKQDGDNWVLCPKCTEHTHVHTSDCAVCKGGCGKCLCTECAVGGDTVVCNNKEKGTAFIAGYCETCWNSKVSGYRIADSSFIASGSVSSGTASHTWNIYPFDVIACDSNAGTVATLTISNAADLEKIGGSIGTITIADKNDAPLTDTDSDSATVTFGIPTGDYNRIRVTVPVSFTSGGDYYRYFNLNVSKHLHDDGACAKCPDCGECVCAECQAAIDNGAYDVCPNHCYAELCPTCNKHIDRCTCFTGVCVSPEAYDKKASISQADVDQYSSASLNYIPLCTDFGFTINDQFKRFYSEYDGEVTVTATAKLGDQSLETDPDFDPGYDAQLILIKLPISSIEGKKAGDKLTIKVHLDVKLPTWDASKALDYDFIVTICNSNEIVSVNLNDGYSTALELNKTYSGSAHVQFSESYKGGCTPKVYWTGDVNGSSVGWDGSIPVTSCKFDKSTGNISFTYSSKDITDKIGNVDLSKDSEWNVTVEAETDNGYTDLTGFYVTFITDKTKIAEVKPSPYRDVTMREGETKNIQFVVTKGPKYTGGIKYEAESSDGITLGTCTYDAKTGIISVPVTVTKGTTNEYGDVELYVWPDDETKESAIYSWCEIYIVSSESQKSFNELGNTLSLDKNSAKYKEGETVVVTATCTYPASPKEGDVRYVPFMWQVNPIGYWYHEPEQSPYKYVAEIAGLAPGKHTVTVTYRKEVYDGSRWDNASGNAILTKDIIVEAKSGGDGKKDTTKTGDSVGLYALATFMLLLSIGIAAGLIIDKLQLERWRRSVRAK